MARVQGGFLGNLAGSVGNVTFARARGGIQTARIRATPSNPRSTAQQTQRGRFKQIQQFASAFLAAGLIRPFWRLYATGGLSAYNAFMRTNSAAMPVSFDPEAAQLSRGNGLAGVSLSAVDLSGVDPNTYVLAVDNPSAGDIADFLVGVIYNGNTWQAIVADTGATRGDGGVDVPVPEVWLADADALFAYAFAYMAEPGGTLRLSDSSVLKVTAEPFEVPAPDVPPAQDAGEQAFGQAT